MRYVFNSPTIWVHDLAMDPQANALKHEAVENQVNLIRSFVQVLPEKEQFPADAWEKAMVAGAKAAGAARVITDHPDLLERETSDGIEFVSTEAWLLEATTPPPVPGG